MFLIPGLAELAAGTMSATLYYNSAILEVLCERLPNIGEIDDMHDLGAVRIIWLPMLLYGGGRVNMGLIT